MKLNDFLNIPLDERADFVWQHGIYLGYRHLGNCDINLYYTDPFFAEIWYNNFEEQICMVRGFNNSRLLDPYLDTIELPALFKA